MKKLIYILLGLFCFSTIQAQGLGSKNKVKKLKNLTEIGTAGDTDTLTVNKHFKIGRVATFTVAASNSSTRSKLQADYLCDGNADDVQIQAALDALSVDGVVQLTEGDFVVAQRIDVPSNTILQGMGMDATSITGPGTEGASTCVVIRIPSRSDVIVRDMKLDAGWTAASVVQDIGVINVVGTENTPCNNILLENLFCTNAPSHGIAIKASKYVTVRKCKVTNVFGDDGIAITDYNLGANVTEHVLIDDCHVIARSGVGAAYEVDDGPRYVTFRNCYADTSRFDVHLHTDGAIHPQAPSHIYFENCVTTNTTSGGFVCFTENGAVSGQKVHDINYTNCVVENNTSDFGISFWSVDNSSAIGCDVEGSGIEVRCVTSGTPQNECEDITISHCYIDSAKDKGIHTVDCAGGLKITNNTIINGSDFGMLIQAQNTVMSNVTITGNHVLNNTSYSIYLLPVVAINNLDVSHNIVDQNIRVTGTAGYTKAKIVNNVFSSGYVYANKALENDVVWSECVSEVFMDCLAADSNKVVDNEDISSSASILATVDARPDMPRNSTITITDANTSISAFECRVWGINARGYVDSDTFSFSDGLEQTGVVAFAIVDSVRIDGLSGNGASDILCIGIGDKLGLTRLFYLTADVYKTKKNTADLSVPTVNVTYGTVDFSTITANDDFTVWYKSDLNTR